MYSLSNKQRMLLYSYCQSSIFCFRIGQKHIMCWSAKCCVYCIALATRQPVHNRTFIYPVNNRIGAAHQPLSSNVNLIKLFY